MSNHTSLLAVGLASLVLVSGCAFRDRPPEERMENAADDLDQAREERARAEKGVTAAREELRGETTDTAISRSIQARLLEDRSLFEQAIVVQVQEGNVRLVGEVDTDEQRRKALQIAAATPGVNSVAEDLSVAGADAAEPANEDKAPERY